jgi:peptidoglycan hydrolase-like protein with peptidoglycan-binding domain
MRRLSNALATGAIVAAALSGVAAWPAFADDAASKQTPTTEAPAAAPAQGGSTDAAPSPDSSGQATSGSAAAPSDATKPDDKTSQAAPAAKPKKNAALSRTRVEHVQTALAQSGEDVPIDGLWGPKTSEALKDFQKSHGLKATGHLNHATVKALSKTG